MRNEIVVFCIMTPCSLVGGYWHFEGTCCLHLQGWSAQVQELAQFHSLWGRPSCNSRRGCKTCDGSFICSPQSSQSQLGAADPTHNHIRGFSRQVCIWICTDCGSLKISNNDKDFCSTFSVDFSEIMANNKTCMSTFLFSDKVTFHISSKANQWEQCSQLTWRTQILVLGWRKTPQKRMCSA
jgi:hypothetical protein